MEIALFLGLIVYGIVKTFKHMVNVTDRFINGVPTESNTADWDDLK